MKPHIRRLNFDKLLKERLKLSIQQSKEGMVMSRGSFATHVKDI